MPYWYPIDALFPFSGSSLDTKKEWRVPLAIWELGSAACECMPTKQMTAKNTNYAKLTFLTDL